MIGSILVSSHPNTDIGDSDRASALLSGIRKNALDCLPSVVSASPLWQAIRSARWHGRVPIAITLAAATGVLVLLTAGIVFGVGVRLAQKNTLDLLNRNSPQAITAFVNHHFSLVVECIESEEGTVDKFMGDAVMAFWQETGGEGNNAERACRGALTEHLTPDFSPLAVGSFKSQRRIGEIDGYKLG